MYYITSTETNPKLYIDIHHHSIFFTNYAKKKTIVKGSRIKKQAGKLNQNDVNQSDDPQVCWICYEQLMKNNREQMPCGHDNYCKTCMKKMVIKGEDTFPDCIFKK